MSKKMHFVWSTPDTQWIWESSRYEGNGIFYGKVKSPFVPEGEYGTWYLWEVEKHAQLVEGDPELLNSIRSKAKKVMEIQKSMMGGT